jgi:hypothetical protein
MGPDGEFITGSDFLMDGGVTASYFFGELAPDDRPCIRAGSIAHRQPLGDTDADFS